MRKHLSVLAMLLSVVAGRAEVWDVTADWLNTHTLMVGPGDQARIVGTPMQRDVNLLNLDWQGGELTLDSCRISSLDRSVNSLPFVVAPGQVLNLTGTWIEGAATAVVVSGGTANLNQVTLASLECNIRSNHPASQLLLQNSNLCNAALGLALDSCSSASIQGSLFLTNDCGLSVGSASLVQIEDCLFQGNERAITIKEGGTPPQLLANVDLVDARYALIENLSPHAVDLGNAHVDEISMVTGPWQRTGVDPGVPAHPLKISEPVVIADDEVIPDIPLESYRSTDGIPCRISMFKVLHSNNAYSGFIVISENYHGEQYHLSPFQSGTHYYYVVSCIGEWK